YEVVVVYSKRKETPKDFIKDFDDRIRFINISMKRSINPMKNINAYYKLKEIINNENPDIVHLHSSIAGFLGRMACFFNRYDMKKVYYNPHGLAFLQKNENYIKRMVFYMLEKIASKFGGLIIGCSKGEYEEIKKFTDNTTYINNGVNIDMLMKTIEKSNNQVINQNKIRIGTIGRISYQKNPKLFNEIAVNFKDYEFVWIGDGELREELKSENIKVTGWLKKEDVIKELVNLDIFIMTSLWEGLPIALLEAMYLSKACVVTNVIGNRDVIQNNLNGYIVNDVKEFIIKLEHLIKNENIKKDLGKRAKEDVLNYYNSKLMIENYKNLYRKRR
ncbi:MAG: glycosyltransferase, partial [bacterium]|nr:glycosyltransferase [bacterium]